jgi:hypothetical protein
MYRDDVDDVEAPSMLIVGSVYPKDALPPRWGEGFVHPQQRFTPVDKDI